MNYILLLVSLLSVSSKINEGNIDTFMGISDITSRKILSYGYTIEDASCMALNIYHEARGEGSDGMYAVAHVVMNRTKSIKFHNTPCEVIKAAKMYTNWKGNYVPVRNKCHFSWYCDGISDSIVLVDKKGIILHKNVESWKKSNMIAIKVLLGMSKDNTYGATHYYNPRKASPSWADNMVTTTTIGNHTFLKPKRL